MGLVARVGTLRVLPLWAQQCPYKYGRCIRPAEVCSFGANSLHLGNVGKRVFRRFLGLQLFHVKRLMWKILGMADF